MTGFKSTTTIYTGDPIVLKDHSITEIEECISTAISKLTGQELVISLNNFQFVTYAKIGGERASASFDVQVRSQTKEVETEF